MRALLVVALLAWAGCAPTKQPEATSAGNEPHVADATAVDTVELTRGERLETHGVGIMLRGTGTEHQANSAIVIRAELDVRKGDQQRTVSLEREQPGEATFVEVFDLQLALETVDATRKPSRAQILVRR